MRAYESSAATLRNILAHPLLQREKIDETMEALEVANADARDVNDAIRLGAETLQEDIGIDDSELEAELQALADEVEVEKGQVLDSATLRAPTHPPHLEDPSGSVEEGKVSVVL